MGMQNKFLSPNYSTLAEKKLLGQIILCRVT
nr:MAG TPA: hypothetical protein [Caudoviricetes sp.]